MEPKRYVLRTSHQTKPADPTAADLRLDKIEARLAVIENRRIRPIQALIRLIHRITEER